MAMQSGFIKRIRDIMRMDAGINGDAQRIEQMVWILFLKVYDAKEDDWELFIGSHAKERLYRHVEMGGMADKINQNTLIKLFKRNANEIVRNCGTDKTVRNRHNLNTKTASFIIIDRKRNPNLNVICTYLSYKNGVYKFVINTVISKNAFKVKNEN